MFKKIKEMKNTLKQFLFICLLAISTSSMAQRDADSSARKLTDKMNTQLTLSTDQYSKVYDVNVRFANELSTEKASGASKMALLKKMKSLDKQRDKELKDILSKEQYDIYSGNKKDNRKQLKAAYKNKKG
jgi:hypothetical protein